MFKRLVLKCENAAGRVRSQCLINHGDDVFISKRESARKKKRVWCCEEFTKAIEERDEWKLLYLVVFEMIWEYQ